MHNVLYFYQHIPYHTNPVAFYFFNLPVDWYSLMYLAGFLTVYLLLWYRIKKREIQNEIPNTKYQIPDTNILLDLMLVTFGGLLVGGRLGYVFFYNFNYYIQNPITIISPFDPITHEFIGIFGMSYHGALIGALLAGWIFIKIKKLDFWRWANFIAPAIPAGYFFGRIGNFMNGELYGRVTDKFWGMYFPQSAYDTQNFSSLQLRYPSELNEAFLEGIVLFLILWPLRNHPRFKNHMLAFYIIGYAAARIIAEFFRQPDSQIGYIFGWLTLGQILSIFMLIFGIGLILVRQHNKKMV